MEHLHLVCTEDGNEDQEEQNVDGHALNNDLSSDVGQGNLEVVEQGVNSSKCGRAAVDNQPEITRDDLCEKGEDNTADSVSNREEMMLEKNEDGSGKQASSGETIQGPQSSKINQSIDLTKEAWVEENLANTANEAHSTEGEGPHPSSDYDHRGLEDGKPGIMNGGVDNETVVISHSVDVVCEDFAESINSYAGQSDCSEIHSVSNNPNVMKSFQSTKFVMEATSSEDSDIKKSSNNNECVCFIDHLPVEIVEYIFRFFTTKELAKVCLVCKRWRDLAMDPIYWQSISFDYNVEIEKVQDVLSRTPLLRHLGLQGCESLTSTNLKEIVTACPQIKHLNLGFISNIGREMILGIVEHIPKIEKLNIEGSKLVDTNCVSALAQLKSLTVLNISHCTALYDFHVQNLVSNLPCLLDINLDGITWVSDQTVKKIWQICGTWLEVLHLDGAELTDISLEYLGNCTELRTFSISFGENITDQGIQHIAKWKQLKSLRLRKCTEVSSPAIEKLFAESESMDNLQSIDLTECAKIEDAAITAIAKTCKNLRSFTLCWCWNITELGLKTIIQNSPNLRTLDLTGLKAITGECLIDIPTKTPKLTLLDLRSCNDIIDEVIVDVVLKYPDLVAYNYYGDRFPTRQ